MKTPASDTRDTVRRRDARIARIVLIAFALVEAVVIFGVIVPALLE